MAKVKPLPTAKQAATITKGILVESLPLKILKPDPDNVRVHSEANIQAVMRSLKRFGQQKPIVVDKSMTVIAGNGTLEAAKRLGWSVIGVIRTRLEGAEAKAYAIADNKTGDLSEFDYKKLGKQLQELKIQKIDLLDTGFSDFEIEPLTDKKWDGKKKSDDNEDASDKLFRVPGNEWKKLAAAYERFRERAGLTNDTDSILLILKGKFAGK